MAATYQIFISDALGNRLVAPKDWSEVEYVRAENNIGALTLTLPYYYDRNIFKKDGTIEVWRSLDGGLPYLDVETLWLIRGWRRTIKRGLRFWIIRAVDLNHLLKRRIVDYFAASAQAAQTDQADDMCKVIVRQNFTAAATDATRSIGTYLTVQADVAAGPSIRKAFAWRNVLTILQELAQASFQAGTYLAFDIVPTVLPNSGSTIQFEFRTYTGQRGVDHTFPGGNPPVLLGPAFDDLDEVILDEDASDEITRSIVGGQGTEAARSIARANDAARQGESPFNLCEGFQNAYNESDTATGLPDEADTLLKSGRPKKNLSGKIVQTSGFIYGLHWRWGDLVTAQIENDSFNAHIDRVHVNVKQDTGETVEAFIRSAT